jgi:uncharacterized cupredoxin-like copper-binding protein
MKKKYWTIGLAALSFAIATDGMSHGNQEHGSSKKFIEYGEQTAFGRVGVAQEVSKQLNVELLDQLRFQPALVRVNNGETVEISFRNSGKLKHEWVLGTSEEIAQHAELMRRFPNMAHDEPHMVHLAPNEQRQLVWQFNRPGVFEYACLLPGHYEAGMRGLVEVQ